MIQKYAKPIQKYQSRSFSRICSIRRVLIAIFLGFGIFVLGISIDCHKNEDINSVDTLSSLTNRFIRKSRFSGSAVELSPLDIAEEALKPHESTRKLKESIASSLPNEPQLRLQAIFPERAKVLLPDTDQKVSDTHLNEIKETPTSTPTSSPSRITSMRLRKIG